MICSLVVFSCTRGAPPAWCQQSNEPALDLVIPQPDVRLPETTDSSRELTPYPPQPAVNIGGPFGVVIGRGYGLRIGGPNGVRIGGGRAVRIGPPVTDDSLTRLNSVGAIIGAANRVTLQYPESAPRALQFRINGSDVVISPGETIQLDGRESVVVRVPKLKGRRGIPRFLPAGHYVFRQTARGWRLARGNPASVDEPPAEHVSNPDGSLELEPLVIEFNSDPVPAMGPSPAAELRAEEISSPGTSLELQPPVIEIPQPVRSTP
ncbi:MAG: hypothetical protein ACC628_19585 [Pirellulaceae bacterium]